MSPYEQNILDFYKIYKDRPELFTNETRALLEALKVTLSEDASIEQISDAIALWCEEHPNILNALLELPPIDTGERGPGGPITRLTPKEALELLENIVRQSKPDSEPPSPQPLASPKK